MSGKDIGAVRLPRSNDTVACYGPRSRADAPRPILDHGAGAQMHHLDDAAPGGSGASGDRQRLVPARRGGPVALEACEDDVLVVYWRPHVRDSLIGVCHRFPELRLLCVAFETPICLPFPAQLCAMAPFGFVLPEVLLLP